MKSKVKSVTRKTFKIRESGRSSDFITPSFGFGCLLNCSYCYMKRHLAEGLSYAKNTGDILTHINSHAMFTDVEKPNQTDSQYITYDIACNEDFALHSKYYNWRSIFDFFKDHPTAKATFATKIVPSNFLEYNPKDKVRIRFSLMPQKMANILEPNASKILDKINAINEFKKAGYDVHLNFSPVVVYKGWLEDYKELFSLVNKLTKEEFKSDVLSEVIFLTHNKNKHQYNLDNNISGEEYLWTPENQETKISSYGGENIRYKRRLKKQYVEEFKTLHNSIIPWNTIRYIF